MDRPNQFLLHTLAETGNYVFHGTSKKGLMELSSHQHVIFGQHDGAPAVSATTEPEVAIFKALYNGRNKAGMSLRKRHIYNMYNPFGFVITESLYETVHKQHTPGFVYALAKSAFHLYSEKPDEWRSPHPIVPLASVRVTELNLSTVPLVMPDDQLATILEQQSHLHFNSKTFIRPL